MFANAHLCLCEFKLICSYSVSGVQRDERRSRISWTPRPTRANWTPRYLQEELTCVVRQRHIIEGFKAPAKYSQLSEACYRQACR